MNANGHLPLNEFFQTVQGEGGFTGTPAVFVRLQGCAVGCPWCDTKHTWDLRHETSLDAVLAKDGAKDDPRFAWVTVPALLDLIDHTHARHVVITGGEPCQYDLTELTTSLMDRHVVSQIETSGTETVLASPSTFVTVSPKVDMPGGKTVRADAFQRANEIKMPVGKSADIHKLDDLIHRMGSKPSVWLQPISESAKATELCREVAQLRGWRVSLQLHKGAGIR